MAFALQHLHIDHLDGDLVSCGVMSTAIDGRGEAFANAVVDGVGVILDDFEGAGGPGIEREGAHGTFIFIILGIKLNRGIGEKDNKNKIDGIIVN